MQKISIVINVPKEIRDVARDISRELSGFARNFYFQELTTLHINMQYLGNNVSPESIEMIKELFQSTIPQISAPEITIRGLRFGEKSKLRPQKIYLEILASENLKQLSSAIHNSIKELALDDIRKYKDFGKHIYKIIVATTKRGMSRSISNDIQKKFSEKGHDKLNLVFKPASVSVVASTYNGKISKYSEVYSCDFAKSS